MKFTDFERLYPNYNKYRFSNGGGKVWFQFNGDEYNPFDENGNLVKTIYEFPILDGHTYKPENIKDFLADGQQSFPNELKLGKTSYPIICTQFDKTPPNFDPIEIDIYVTPSQKFSIKPRNIFIDIVLKHINSKEAYKWLAKSDMNYYPQQLSFAMWCSTSGCGIGYDMIDKYDNPMIGSLLQYHILFTCRRILSIMGVPLPGDKFFNNIDNRFDKNGYNKVCREFDVSPNSDFRYTADENNGLGRIYKDIFGKIHDVTESYDKKLDGKYTNQWPGGYFNFKDQGSSWGGKEIDHISPLEEHPYLYFLLNESKGLTKPGLSRLNQSIESYVYCILGSQANTRSIIIGDSGGAQEAQKVFLQLFESTIIESDISKSISRYQMAVQLSKQKLDLAVVVGCWLLPSNLVINTQSVIGYNNKLLKVTDNMSFGVNNINNETKSIGSKHNMGKSKVNLPHKTEDKPSSNRHDTNLTAITIGSAALAWYIFR